MINAGGQIDEKPDNRRYSSSQAEVKFDHLSLFDDLTVSVTDAAKPMPPPTRAPTTLPVGPAILPIAAPTAAHPAVLALRANECAPSLT